MIRQRLLVSSLLLALAGVVVNCGDVQARGYRCRGNNGWRQNNYSYSYGYGTNGYVNGIAPQGNTNFNTNTINRPTYAPPVMNQPQASNQQMPNPAPIDPTPIASTPAPALSTGVAPAAAPYAVTDIDSGK